jgi:methyltransferase (TIGR00027 family)
MVRTDDDSWDITESVGATALGVAMARAAESDCDCPLFTDRYAEPFVDAAVKRGWDSSVIGARLPMIKDYAAVRTKWFDEYFIAAGANGIDQTVILAAGLDARAWRLPWVTGSAIYEIDQPRVLAFKADVLTARGAQPAGSYQPCARLGLIRRRPPRGPPRGCCPTCRQPARICCSSGS